MATNPAGPFAAAITATLAAVPVLAFAVAAAAADPVAFDTIALENRYPMQVTGTGFTGPGWDLIADRTRASDYTLVGEDHFTREIPRLFRAIAGVGTFEVFYVEVDPVSTAIIDRTFTEMDAAARDAFNRRNRDMYSFYALGDEYELLADLKQRGLRLLGADQIVLYADRLVLAQWPDATTSESARGIYQAMLRESESAFAKFLADPSTPFYFLTPAFSDHLEALAGLPLSAAELALVDALKRSVDIYVTQSHVKRVQLIKHILMNDYERWAGHRTLFKYGANHLARSESFLTVTDIGNLVANLAEARYETTFHVMVLGESGAQGSPFRGFPPTAIDPDDFFLKPLAPFFRLTDPARHGDDWQVFDLLPLRSALARGRLSIDDENLRRTIRGYDALVLIPVVTPAAFPDEG